MKRFFPIAIFCLLAASTSSVAAEHSLLAHASADRTWVAQVSATDSGGEKTDILVRDDGAGKAWQKLATIPARVVAMASRSSQLAVLLSDGRWEAVWAPSGASTGTPLPASGQIVALTDDGQSLWAIGSVHGGISAAIAAATTRPTTAATTQPSKSSGLPDLPAALVLFHQSQSQWLPVSELAFDDMSHDSDISLAVVGDEPMVTFRSVNDAVQISKFSAQRGWQSVTRIPAALVEFQLLSVAKVPILWTNLGKGPGSLYPIGSVTSSFVDLIWPDSTAPQSLPAVAAVGATLTLFGVHDGKLYEQRYNPDGKPLGGSAVVSAPVDVRDTNLGRWIDAALMIALGFSVVATLYRRSEQQRRNGGEVAAPPLPAPHLPRLGAGLIDMLPVLSVLGYMSVTIDPAHGSMAQMESVQMWIAYFIAVGVYLLHTTLTEIFTGRTIGKFIFGLKTVTIEGGVPHVGQILIRNFLRIIDLIWFPLTLVIISPLRQRSGDVAAGTMVIRSTPQEPADDTSDGS